MPHGAPRGAPASSRPLRRLPAGPSFVLLPGLDATGHLLEPFRPDSLVLSYPPDEILDYAALVDYVLPRLPDGRLTLIAESFSGPIATRIAARFPERVASLVFCNSFVTPPRSPLLRFLARPALFRIRVPERVLAYLMLSPFATPELTALFARTIAEVHPAVLAARVRQLLTVDDRETLARVRCPIVYLRGTHDRLVPEKAVRAIVSAAPSTRVVRIAAPHAILQTAPEAAWATIIRYVCT